jgi:hypothetical protein
LKEEDMLSQQKDRSRTGCRTTKRLLGKILVDGRFIPPRDLDLAVELQAKTNDQLGEILVRMGVLNPTELAAVLSIQKDLASLEEAVKVGAGVRLLLGELLIKAKRLSREQLDIALREQQRTGEKLGEVLVRQGLLLENELHAVLAFQKSQAGEAPVSDKLKLGEILVTTGQITREQLEDVLHRQKLSQKKIGELLIEAGYAKPHQVDFGLKLQQKLLTAALIAVLSLSNMIGAGTAYSSDYPGAALSATREAATAGLDDGVWKAGTAIDSSGKIWDLGAPDNGDGQFFIEIHGNEMRQYKEWKTESAQLNDAGRENIKKVVVDAVFNFESRRLTRHLAAGETSLCGDADHPHDLLINIYPDGQTITTLEKCALKSVAVTYKRIK